MRIERKKPRHRAKAMEDVIVFVIGGTRFLISARAVDEIRNLEGLEPYHPASFAQAKMSKVKHTLVRANKDPGKVYFVVEAASHFQMRHSKPGRVLVMRDRDSAVLVDGIERMAQISGVQDLPRAFKGDERKWYRGVATIGEQVLPVVDPNTFLTKGEAAVLSAGAKVAAAAARREQATA